VNHETRSTQWKHPLDTGGAAKASSSSSKPSTSKPKAVKIPSGGRTAASAGEVEEQDGGDANRDNQDTEGEQETKVAGREDQGEEEPPEDTDDADGNSGKDRKQAWE
jgi:hypothetical protein